MTQRQKMWRLAVLVAGLAVLWGGPATEARKHKASIMLRAASSAPPAAGFEANYGQSAGPARFLWRGRCRDAALSAHQVDFSLCPPAERKSPAALPERFTALAQRFFSLHLVGANEDAPAQGVERLPVTSNYLLGRDPRGWQTGIPHFRQVRFAHVYPGIHALYQSSQGQLRYDFIVTPQADPRRIKLRFDNVDALAIDGAGNLLITLDGATVIQRKPFLYQDIGGAGRPVNGRYVLLGPRLVGLEIGAYDPRYTLVIDPTLNFATFLGGSGADMGTSIAVIQEGKSFVTGVTTSANFPTTSGAVSSLRRGPGDVFVTRYNAAGAVEASTYLGGDGSEEGTGIAVDQAGNVYLTGTTDSANFPTTAGSFRTQLTGGRDAFAVKLNAAGNALVYGTYLGGSGADDGAGVALDLNNNAYLTGITDSDNFPVTASACQPNKSAGSDAFFARLNAAGTALSYATYLGGGGTDWALGVATDVTGNAYLSGLTASANFPTTPNVAQAVAGGASDGFVAKIDPARSGANSLRYSTYLGGGSSDWSSGIAVDPTGNALVAGLTNSANFPVTAGAWQASKRGSSDAFVTKVNPDGAALAYSTYLGGGGADMALSVSTDSAGQAFVAGGTQSFDFPVTTGAYQTALAGRSDGFASKINNSGTALLTSTYFGGSQDEEIFGIAPRIASQAFVTGSTNSANLPTATPAQATIGGGDDAFVANLGDTATTTPLETARFFVRQHYLDFLSRDPDEGGWDYWTGQVTQCGADANCIRARRVEVSNAFFFELEFQQTGAYVYRLYRAAFGNTQPFPNPSGDNDTNPYCQQTGCPFRAAHIPSYTRFVTDRARVVGSQNLAADQLALANLFVERPEFVARYPATLTGAQYVDALLARVQADSGANLNGQRDALITLFNSGGRGAVLYRLADDNVTTNPINNRAFIDAEYNRGFVLTQYFGYLRRDPDQPGLNFWRDIVARYPLRSLVGQNAMVCAFITAQEYQERFSGLSPRNNGECPPAP